MGITLYSNNEPYKVIEDHIIFTGVLLGVLIAYDCRDYLWIYQILMIVMFVFSIYASLLEEIPVVIFFMFIFSIVVKYRLDKDEVAN